MKRMRKRAATAAAAFLVVATGVYFGGTWWENYARRERTDNAYVRADITAISPKIAGYVTEVLVDDNQVVEAGAILLRIEDNDYLAQRDRAAAAVAQAEATAQNLSRRKSLQQANIREAEAMIDVARAELELSRRELARATRWLTKDGRHSETTTPRWQKPRVLALRLFVPRQLQQLLASSCGCSTRNLLRLSPVLRKRVRTCDSRKSPFQKPS